MTETYIDVPVDQIRVGDFVAFTKTGVKWFQIKAIDAPSLWVYSNYHRVENLSSITAARRRVEGRDCFCHCHRCFVGCQCVSLDGKGCCERAKPPEPGTWQCRNAYYEIHEIPHNAARSEIHNNACAVYRESEGWSRDTRTGQAWVPKNGDPIQVASKYTPGKGSETIYLGPIERRKAGAK